MLMSRTGVRDEYKKKRVCLYVQITKLEKTKIRAWKVPIYIYYYNRVNLLNATA